MLTKQRASGVRRRRRGRMRRGLVIVVTLFFIINLTLHIFYTNKRNGALITISKRDSANHSNLDMDS